MDANEMFKPSEMSSILAAAILEKMGAEERSAMLASALQYLMTPGPSKDYGRTPGVTPVQAAFDQSAGFAIQQVTREIMDADEAFQARLRELVTEKIQEALAADSWFEGAVQRGVAEAMSKRSW